MDNTPDAEGAPIRARLALIAAVAKNGVIGAGNAMPWHIPGELQHFRALTMGHRIVMGRRTWQSIGRPLPGRENVVVTRDAAFAAPGCIVAPSFAAALLGSTLALPIFCIGGAQLYAQALPLADELRLTEIDRDFDGDTTMPPIPRGEWREQSREARVDASSGLHYAFVHYVRIGSPADRAFAPAGGGPPVTPGRTT